MYKLIRSFFFLFDAEKVHYFAMNALRFFCSIGFIRKLLAASFQPTAKNLAVEKWGLEFKNPVGLAAGFDKNAKYLRELEVLGFGFVEIGTVTPKPQDGNDKPRLFRLPKDKAIINRMGFNNEGVEAVKKRLVEWRRKYEVRRKKYDDHSPLTTHHSHLIIGGNIGKNKVTPNEDAWKDYEICFNELFDYVDYFVVNVSSPNTPGLRQLQEKDSLHKILSHLQTLRAERLKLKAEEHIQKPILLKIAPDLTQSQLDDVIDLAREIQLDGLVASNTTISREGLSTDSSIVAAIGAGGLSGLPVKKRSTEIVQYIAQKLKGEVPVMASGGIFTAADAKEKLNAGAALVQVWTGFIYEGPAIAKKICNNINQ
ncbi:quinone-dependent dihydroorotate dehydrogenase [Lacibacter sediminis]|uniref:Dihydroorotate dehydrogenase (quinone) n=1 Tax=Lacibacter sediminis TaxID=2760713 RepID=A0A7G5XEV5_9BACT|nr:quinone-dependent dihydroorotate dehydrogenase [Lacibacter sediminis]QNA44008.1 quinone-dependent dihydroorotate dehydrogenase [Lacibacter sediminis]